MQSRSRMPVLTFTLAICLLGAAIPSAVMAAGTCREANCGASAPKEDKCDRAALDKATSEFNREMKAYDEAKEKAKENWAKAFEIYNKEDELFRETFSLPEASTAGVELSMHVVMEKIIASGGGKAAEHLAEEFASVGSAASLALMLYKAQDIDRKVLRSLNEFNQYSDAALNDMDEGFPHLQAARKAREKMDKLEANCKSKDTGGKPKEAEPEEEEWKPSGQREAEAAQRIISSWKKVGADNDNATAKFTDGATQFEDALAIVQSRDESSVTSGFIRVAATTNNGAPDGRPLSDKKRAKAVKRIADAFRNITAAGKSFVRIGEELKKIGQTQAKMKL